jgi:hypothetical protein
MIDLITVVFEPELESLRLQARSIDLYVDHVDSIIIVVNDDSMDSNVILKQWWGRYSHRVQIISRNQFGTKWCHNGWVSQQALKIVACKVCRSEWAVILDAKTIFVKSFAIDPVRPRVGLLNIYPVFESSKTIANGLFGTNLQKQLGPGGVPFVINVPFAGQMIDWIEKHTGQNFVQWFQAQGMLTEFILYSAWIQHHTGSLDSIYDTSSTNIRPANICHSEVGIFEQKFRLMQEASTVSIHRDAWSRLGVDQQRQFTDFLHTRGIQ